MFHTILFDLDGTLLDTLEDLTDSVNYVLRSHAMPERTIEEIKSFIGNGIPTLIRRAVPSGTAEETSIRLTAEMKEYYKAHAQRKTKPYGGIQELLQELKNRSIQTAVVTNKAEPAAKILCGSIFGDVFAVIIGDNGKDRLKPAPDNVFRAMELLHADQEHTLYVGDSDVDMETAANAGLESVGVLWGFRDEATLRSSGAKHIAASPAELLALL